MAEEFIYKDYKRNPHLSMEENREEETVHNAEQAGRQVLYNQMQSLVKVACFIHLLKL